MRDELSHRPLLLALAGLVAGLTAVAYPLNGLMFLFLLGFVRGLVPRLVLCGFLLLGLALATGPVSTVVEAQKAAKIEGTVATAARFRSGSVRYDLNTSSGIIELVTPSAGLVQGERMEATGDLKPPLAGGRPEIVGWLFVRSPGAVRVLTPAPWFYRLADGWRRSFVAFTQATLDPSQAAAVDALCFNVDAVQDPAAQQQLQRAGAVAIVAASGLHVLVLALLLRGLFSLLPLPRWLQLLLVLFLLAFYAAATGFRPSVVRAIIAATLAFGAPLFRREPDILSALGLAGLVYLILRPDSIYEMGFQISFLTVAGFALFLTRFRRRQKGVLPRFGGQVRDVFATSAMAAVVGAPLAAFYTGVLSVSAFGANILLLGVLAPIVGISMLAYVLWPAIPSVSAGLMQLAVGPLVGWIYFVLEKLGGMSWSALEVPAFSGYWLGLFYLALLLTWRKRVRPA